MTGEYDDIVLPVRRQDGDTLEERMTENAYNRILPERYLNKGPNGELVEDQEDFFHRLAKNIAVADVVYHNTDVFVSPVLRAQRRDREDHLAQGRSRDQRRHRPRAAGRLRRRRHGLDSGGRRVGTASSRRQ